MEKLNRLLSLPTIVLFLFSLSCVSVSGSNVLDDMNNAVREMLPRQSVVFIEKTFELELCLPDKDGKEKCLRQKTGARGSGSVVGKIGNHSAILTADHVCTPNIRLPEGIPEELSKLIKISNVKITIKDIDGKVYETSILEMDKLNDLCLIRAKGLNTKPIIHLSGYAPKVGDTTYNVSYPLGIYLKGYVFSSTGFLNGYYIDEDTKVPYAVVSNVSIGGVSGSCVVNSKGKLIGLIHSGLSSFPFFSLSPTYEVLKNFLDTSFAKHCQNEKCSR